MTHYLKEYTRFATIEEMDAAAEQHLSLHWDELTKSDRQVFDIIRRYSVKDGAAHLKHGTIEEATGKSNVTISVNLSNSQSSKRFITSAPS